MRREWRTPVRTAAALMLALGSVSASASQTFYGTISDSECAGSHAGMRMGDTDAECVGACIEAHAAAYVLWEGSRALALSDQRTPRSLAGRRVIVVGTLNKAGTGIDVESISARP